MGMCQCKVAFGVNGDVQVITLVGKEGVMPVVALRVLLYANLANGRSLDQLSCW